MTSTVDSDRRGRALGDERLHELLEKTSRTFALAIPELPQPTLREVTVAYLLFRIADTFEDATVLWPRERRLEALGEFADLLESYDEERGRRLVATWLEPPPTAHSGYLELLREAPAVLAEWDALAPAARSTIGEHTGRTAELMKRFVARTAEDDVLRLESVAELRRYCYAVAGIVGEMLTELFLLDRPHLEGVGGALRERAAAFGEGLQLVNILKDSASDADEGRVFLPRDLDRRQVFELARGDLVAAAEYVLAIQRAGGPDEIVAFTALPVELAWATLDRVERHGPGSKISRAKVFELYHRVHRALAKGRPALAVPTG